MKLLREPLVHFLLLGKENHMHLHGCRQHA
jgi:hypothetical protein